jgi:hypothetical protein
MFTKLDGEGIGRADLVQNTRNLLTVVTTVAGSFVTSWGSICCSKSTMFHAGSPLVSQSLIQSVIKKSIYFEWHWEHHLLHSAINVTFSPFVLLHKYASFLGILNYASNSITTFFRSEIFIEVPTEMLKWFIAFVQHRRSSEVLPKPLNWLYPQLFKPRTRLYTCDTFLCSM